MSTRDLARLALWYGLTPAQVLDLPAETVRWLLAIGGAS